MSQSALAARVHCPGGDRSHSPPACSGRGTHPPLQVAHEGPGASEEMAVATRGYQAPSSAELPSELRTRATAQERRHPGQQPGVLQPAWPWAGHLPALGSSPVRREMVGLQVFQVFASLVVNVCIC